MQEQRMLKGPGPLLDPFGNLADVGWARQPLLDCNLEAINIYSTFKFWQRFRLKRWDYYAVTTPTHFFSFTLGDIGYLGQVFAYVIEFATKRVHEETLTIPLSKGIWLPRNSTEGNSFFDNGKVSMRFQALPGERKITVNWPGFDGAGLNAEIRLALAEEHESTVIVIPMPNRRFYYNRKINCMPASGWVEHLGQRYTLEAQTCLGNLDWGRGIWEYNSFWVWASASGFLADRRTIGLNLGFGFGDTSAATENTLIVNGKVHKLGAVDFRYNRPNYSAPWRMTSADGRLDLTFTPFLERLARTDFILLSSEVHQMFGRYNGTAVLDNGEKITINDLTGFAEEHHARW